MKTGSSFLSEAEVVDIGLASVGRSARISRHARFYGATRIRLGEDVRIDDFAVLSAGQVGIDLEGHNHIAVGALLFGDITLRAWSTVSSRVAVYSTSDDFGVDTHTYPHVEEGRALVDAPVVIGSRVVIGTGSTHPSRRHDRRWRVRRSDVPGQWTDRRGRRLRRHPGPIHQRAPSTG